MPQNPQVKPKLEKISVRKIAQSLGLSPATVSLALNGQRPTSFVSAATRAQVWKAAEEMGYPLDRLRSRRPAVERVAVFLPSVNNPVYGETLLELGRVLNQRHTQVLTHSFRASRDACVAATELFRRHEIDAAVFVGSRSSSDDLPSEDLPFVVIGEVPASVSVWQVRSNASGGGRAVGEYLSGLGHRHIATIFPSFDGLAGQERAQSLRTYWLEQGWEFPDEYIIRTNIESETAMRASITEFLTHNRQTSHPVTALFCFNDWVAGMTLRILRSLSIRVPEDMSVVGYDDSIYAPLLDPPLTTVHQPFDKMGAAGAELLLEQLKPTSKEPKVINIDCQLIVRESCAPPRIS